jgi:serine/threonine protein kinase
MQSPGLILRFWKRIEDKDKRKKDHLVHDDERKRTEIRKGLKALKALTPEDVATEPGRQSFKARKKDLVRKMTRYCRDLKNGDHSAPSTSHFNHVKRATALVKNLRVEELDLSEASEGAEVDWDNLAVDVSALEAELTQPEAAEDEDEGDSTLAQSPTAPASYVSSIIGDEDEGDSIPAQRHRTSEQATEGQPAAHGSEPAAPADLFKAKLRQVSELDLQLRKANPTLAEELRPLLNQAVEHAKGGRFAEGSAALSAFAERARGALPAPADGLPKPPAETTEQWARRIDLNRYKVDRTLKSGNFGTVSLLEPWDLGAPALVFKAPTGASSLRSFRREAEFYQKVGDHPHIVKCLGMRDVGGKRGLVLEAVRGKDMQDTMKRLRAGYKDHKKVTQEQFWGVLQFTLAQTLDTLEHIHKQGVVHHDIKPDNIMIDAATGDIKLVDFGVAADENRQATGGPFGHMAPDNLIYGQVTGQADVFSVGAAARGLGENLPSFDYNAPSAPTDNDEWIRAIKQFGLDLDPEEDTALHRGTADSPASTADRRKQHHKVAGRYGAATEYTKFVNALMHPDPGQRLTLEQARGHPFLRERLLDDDAARAVVRQVLQPEAQPEGEGTESLPADNDHLTSLHLLANCERLLAQIPPLEQSGRTKADRCRVDLARALHLHRSPPQTAEERGRHEEQLAHLRYACRQYEGWEARWEQTVAHLTRILDDVVGKLTGQLKDKVELEKVKVKFEKIQEKVKGDLKNLMAQRNATRAEVAELRRAVGDGPELAPPARDAEPADDVGPSEPRGSSPSPGAEGAESGGRSASAYADLNEEAHTDLNKGNRYADLKEEVDTDLNEAGAFGRPDVAYGPGNG